MDIPSWLGTLMAQATCRHLLIQIIGEMGFIPPAWHEVKCFPLFILDGSPSLLLLIVSKFKPYWKQD